MRSVPDHLPIAETLEELSNYRGVIKCDKPNLDLYDFKGKIEINKKELLDLLNLFKKKFSQKNLKS